MKLRFLALLFAAAVTAVACFEANDHSTSPADLRLERLRRGFTLSQQDPCAAAELFAAAGPGSFLESARMQTWFESLDACGGAPEQWRQLLHQEPPPRLAAGGRCGLARSLLSHGDAAELATWLDGRDLGICELEVLLEMPDDGIAARAARVLAVRAPRRLHQLRAELEAPVVKELSPEELFERSSRMTGEGSPQRAAHELGARHFRGELESRRRLELARAEIARGRPGQALVLLQGAQGASGEGSLVRAAAYRQRGWSRHPGARARHDFAACAEAASRAADDLATDPLRAEAASYAVECATEAGRLRDALSSWRRYRIPLRDTPRYDWIGRRLGVALAVDGGDPAAALELARAMPDQERCLRYWATMAGDRATDTLAELASLPIRDLYARWAADADDEPPELVLTGPLGNPETPESVAWFLAAGLETEAGREWQRLSDNRSLSPRETLAAAQFEHQRGRSDRAIRVLRATFPELGDVTMARLPEDVLRLYLPLRWPRELRRAADENRLPPWLLAGLARQESIFTAHARSPRGAVGVLQLIPSTARIHAGALGLGPRPELRDPAVNLRLGGRELALLIAEFGALEPALAAYNAGPTRARRWWRESPERRRFTETVPIPETYTYIRRVSFLAEAYRQVYAEEWSRQP